MSGRRSIYKKSLSILSILLLIPTPIALGAEIDSEFTKYEGEEIAKDPSAQYILEQIEKSYRILEDLKENNGIVISEKQRLIDEQRQIAKQKLQDELDRMNKKYEEYTPRNAYAKYVSGFPEEYHEFLWEHFNYMYSKVELAREHRDQVIANGGSYQDALDVFVKYAAITKAERNQFTENMIKKYELYNKISSIEDFNDLPDDTKLAYVEHLENIGLGEYAMRPMYDKDPDKPDEQIILPSSVSISDNVDSQVVSEKVSSTVISEQVSTEVFEINTLEQPQNQIVEEITEENSLPELISFEPESLTATNFYGNNYETINLPIMNSVSEFTVSAWVKPDFSAGSSEFTILSKDDAFKLSINNNLPDKVAKFAVFDGFKWTEIQSTSQISEKWTHVAATFDGDKINIYVNGHLEASSIIEGIPTLGPSGYVEFQPVEKIGSSSMILYGAEQFTKHGATYTKSFLSGTVDEVLIDNHKYDEFEIRDLSISSQYHSSDAL